MNCLVCGQGNPAGARFCANCGNPLAAPSSGDVGSEGLIGQLVGGRYLVKRVIGEGGMGVVYEAEQRMGSEVRRVAVKTLLPALSRDPVIVSRFYRECGIVSQLEHPNTIKFFDFGETPDGTLYISMEYVRGQPLTELIAHGPIELERARHILKQVCGALYEAHTMGIVHRDLKPDNIVLTSRAGEADFVKLLDFGIAARTTKMSASETKLTQQGMVLGTPPYMSPEQLTGEPVDGRSDVYSLAVIAYEMLTGRLPFDADTPWQWAQKHMLEAPPPLRTPQGAPVVPPYVEQAVLHALAKKPEDRPATALEFHAELAGERSAGAAPRKLRTLDDELDAPPRTSPMPMLPGPITAQSVAAAHYGGPDRTALAPEFTPAFRTGAAVSSAIPPPQLRPRRRGGLGLALGGLASFAAIGGVIAALAYYEPFEAERVTATTPPVTSATATVVAPVEVPPEVPPQTPATTAPQPAALPPVTKTPAKPPVKRDPPRTPNLPTPPQATTPAQPPPSLPTSPPATQPPPQQPPPTPQPTIPPPPVSPPPVTPPPASEPPASGATGDPACFASRDAAMVGNIEQAASLLRRCQVTGGSARAQTAARQRIRAQVATVVRQRANVGDCAGARSAAAAAASVGAMEGAAALPSTSCASG